MEHFENILVFRVADFSIFLLSCQIFFMMSECYLTEKITSILYIKKRAGARNSESIQKLTKNPRHKSSFMDTLAGARAGGWYLGESSGNKHLGFLISKDSVQPIR